jgi:signal transduction histidine kinase/ligand-binding sensor domain-containing protein/ActR/RegA family two-component response regulator
LTGGYVTVIAQDRQGFMWFGGHGGVLRYDGYRVTRFMNSASDSHSLDNDYVLAIHVDPQGRLWVGTRGGLNLYDAASDGFTRYHLPSIDSQTNVAISVRDIIDDGNGGLWLTTPDGLHHFDPSTGKFIVMNHAEGDPTSLSTPKLNAIVRDARGGLWIGTPAGIDWLAKGSNAFRHFRLDSDAAPNQRHNFVRSLMIDRNQILWIATVEGIETWSFDGKDPVRRRFTAAEGLDPQRVNGFSEDTDGNIWVATQASGLLRWDTGEQRFVAYAHQAIDPYSLVDNQVFAVFQDLSGSLWAGTAKGASRVDLQSGGFVRINQFPGDAGNSSGNKIIGIAGAEGNQVWLGAYGSGLHLLNLATGGIKDFHHELNKSKAEYDDLVQQFCPDKQGRVWIASDKTLSRFDPSTGRFEVREHRDGEPMLPFVHGMTVDHAGIVWFATDLGLFRLDPETNVLRQFKHSAADPDSVSSDITHTVFEDRHGTLWLGTSEGLDRLDQSTGHFTHFHHDPRDATSISSGYISSLYEDASGTLWISAYNGLNRLESGADGRVGFKTYPVKSHVGAMLEDKQGILWISDDEGITRFNPVTGEGKTYTADDGITEGGYYIHSAFEGSDGTMYFGGVYGATAFRPENIRDNHFAPPVFITDFQVFNKSVRGGDGPEGFEMNGAIENAHDATLSYLHSVFSIEFSALHYADPKRNKFAYKLEGFDKDWISTDADRRFVTYTNLDPGHYTFRVKASNKDGIWNEVGATLRITIKPPFWQTWWFRVAVASCLFGSAWLAYRNRIRNFVRTQEMLEKQVAARTAALEESNQALELANQIQREHQSELTRFLAVASHDLRQPLHALNLYLGVLLNIELSDIARPLMENASQCVHIMDEMFLALLDLSRLDAKVVKPVVAPFPIATVLTHLAVEFTPQAQGKGIDFQVEQCDSWVESDIALVEQILRNLIANAVRYTESGQIAISCVKAGGNLRIAVKDTGIGISPLEQKTVFEEFFQVGNMVRDPSKGLGLGLAIVKRLSHLLDVSISLDSARGKGSTFAIELPLASSQTIEPAAAGSPVLERQALSGKLIVVIDDDDSILDAMRALFEQRGCHVIAAKSGGHAIELLGAAERIPDVAICDYRLQSHESGLDAIKLLQMEFNHEIPALLITGDLDIELLQEAASSGLRVLHKPVRVSALRMALIDLLKVEADIY